MEGGVHLPQLGRQASRDGLIRFAQRVDQLGFHSGWVSDHIAWPFNIDSQYPYSDDGSFAPPEDTSLGDHETESCMIHVMTDASWPHPEGGDAEVKNSFGFDPPGGMSSPEPWASDAVTAWPRSARRAPSRASGRAAAGGASRP